MLPCRRAKITDMFVFNNLYTQNRLSTQILTILWNIPEIIKTPPI